MASTAKSILLVTYLFVHLSNAQCILGDTFPTRGFVYSASLLHNQNIYLFGGRNFGQQLERFNIDSETFYDSGEQGMNTGSAYGYAQFWTISNGWTIMPEYNTRNFGAVEYYYGFEYGGDFRGWALPLAAGVNNASDCVAASGNYVYLLRASNSANVLILDYTSNEWLSSVPSSNEARVDSSCLVHSGKLWAFGGKNSATIEYIEVFSITSNAWSYAAGELTEALSGTRAVSFSKEVYVFGGLTQENRGVRHIHLVHTLTKEVRLVEFELPWPATGVVPVKIGDGVYVFAGLAWAYCNLSDANVTTTTALPSAVPTRMPSKNPTAAPSQVPTTSDPVASPSEAPSVMVGSGRGKSGGTDESRTVFWLYVGIISGAGFCVVIVIVLLCDCYRRRRMADKNFKKGALEPGADPSVGISEIQPVGKVPGNTKEGGELVRLYNLQQLATNGTHSADMEGENAAMNKMLPKETPTDGREGIALRAEADEQNVAGFESSDSDSLYKGTTTTSHPYT